MVTRKKIFYLNSAGQINPEAWLNHLKTQRSESKLRLIRHALELCQLTAILKKTPDQIHYLHNSLATADLLVDLMLDENAICAALLYNSICYAELGLQTIKEQLNPQIAKLLKGALRMNHIVNSANQNIKQDQLENFRKMILAIAEDMRVVLLKLAERVIWMRTYQYNKVHTADSRQYARETLLIYTPLANRLGVTSLRYELEDLAMQQLVPQDYQKIAHRVQESLMDREKYVQELALAIEITLPKINIQDFKISSRVKNFYGIYRKMRNKNLPIDKIYDLNAIRIMVNTIEECYAVLKMLSTLWTLVPNELNDYIKHPKENNYRSIHLAIYGVDNKIVEIQIRTFEMHNESEHGMAAHWQYKEVVPAKLDYHTKIAWLRQVMTWQKELVKNGVHFMPEFMATLNDRVYVFTLNGKIIDLSKGATALDFAYHISPETGHYCHSIKVDGSQKPFNYVLNTGEQIETLTSRKLQLNWNWLNPALGYLNTAKARAEVLNQLRKKENHQHMITGQLLLEKCYRQLNLTFVDQNKLASELNFKSKQELLVALGSGELRIVQVLHSLHRYKKQTTWTALDKIENTFKIATCCNPIPGDMIKEHHDQSGILLHRRDCDQHFDPPGAQYQLRENTATYQVSPVETIDIYIYAKRVNHFYEHILSMIQAQDLELLTFSTTFSASKENIYLIIRLSYPNKAQLDHFVNKLKQIPNIITVHSNIGS